MAASPAAKRRGKSPAIPVRPLAQSRNAADRPPRAVLCASTEPFIAEDEYEDECTFCFGRRLMMTALDIS
jgi:hypothetical protein